MNYLSTNQISALWGISPRRIVFLASQGRIKGAKKVDGRWFIPEDSIKPADPRTLERSASQDDSDDYIFPFLLACVHSEAQISLFSEEEKQLYELCMVYERGNFQQARELAEKLLSANNLYVRIGALYHLPGICLYLADYEATERYSILFRTACLSCSEHKAEIAFLLKGFDSEFVSVSEFANTINDEDINYLPDSLLPLVCSWKLFADFARFSISGAKADFSQHEICCRMIEAQGYFFDAMYMHLYLAIYYAQVSLHDKERKHLKRAIEIGHKHKIYFTLSYSLSFTPDTTDELLKDYPPELTERIKGFAVLFFNARQGYAEYQGKTSMKLDLKDEDYLLISYCIKNYSNDKIADMSGLSRSGINKRLSSLYEKLGVKSKKELTEKYYNSVMDWGY